MLNIKEITIEDLKKIYGEKYETIDEIAEEFTIYEEETLEDAIQELLAEENANFIFEMISSGETNRYIERHVAKYKDWYLVNFNEYF